MLADRIGAKWIDAFCEIFARCAVRPGDSAAILSETQSRALNVHLDELSLLRMGARPFHLVVPTPRNRHPVPVPGRASKALIADFQTGYREPDRLERRAAGSAVARTGVVRVNECQA